MCHISLKLLHLDIPSFLKMIVLYCNIFAALDIGFNVFVKLAYKHESVAS